LTPGALVAIVEQGVEPEGEAAFVNLPRGGHLRLIGIISRRDDHVERCDGGRVSAAMERKSARKISGTTPTGPNRFFATVRSTAVAGFTAVRSLG
jgi:hypothetical protein